MILRYQGTPYDCEGFIITCDVTSGWTKDTTQFAPANLPLDVSYTKCERMKANYYDNHPNLAFILSQNMFRSDSLNIRFF